MRVDEHTITIDHVPVFYRSAGGRDAGGADAGSADAGSADAGSADDVTGEAVPVYLHGAPTSSDDWTAFLERSGGVAPDLIGFGRSGKGGHLDYSPEGLTEFVQRFLAELGINRMKLVGHGWGGAIALLIAMREPTRIDRLVVVDAVPLLEGFRWNGLVRMWRRPVIGELVMGSTSRRLLGRHLRSGSVRADAWDADHLRSVWEQFDQGTQRALLRLHRAASEPHLTELGTELRSVEAPALILWGERDPWLGPQFADAYGAELRAATVRRVPDAGHWPWLDQSSVVDLVVDFVKPS